MDLYNLIIYKLDISVEDSKTKIVILFEHDGEKAEAVFFNATKINIDMFSLPNKASFININDNAGKGYQSDVKYYVEEYEDKSISFYCEKYNIKYLK